MSDTHCESLQLANHRVWNVSEWGGISHLYDTRFHLMSRDGGNIVLIHPRVEYSTIFIYSVQGRARIALDLNGIRP